MKIYMAIPKTVSQTEGDAQFELVMVLWEEAK